MGILPKRLMRGGCQVPCHSPICKSGGLSHAGSGWRDNASACQADKRFMQKCGRMSVSRWRPYVRGYGGAYQGRVQGLPLPTAAMSHWQGSD